jgi:hypothetical protein
MKNLICAALVTLLSFALAGNAAAEYEYGATSSLALSIYNPATGVETGYDLGVGVNLAQQNVRLGSVEVSDTDATVALYSAAIGYQSFFGLTTAYRYRLLRLTNPITNFSVIAVTETFLTDTIIYGGYFSY